MKKFFLCLLVLAGSLSGALNVNAQWAVTDTVIPDGYYYIRSNYAPDGTAAPGCVIIRGITNSSALVDFKAAHIKNMTLITKNDLNAIWHIWRDDKTFSEGSSNYPGGSPQYHIKNCGVQPETYLYPHRPVGGQSTYNYGTGVEQDVFLFRTKDWGSETAVDDPWAVKFDRKDVPADLSSSKKNDWMASYPDSAIQTADKMFFIRPTSSLWRWRLGDNELVKVRSSASLQSGSFYVTPICADSLPGGCIEWLQLNEAITDATGMGLEVGVNPGNVNSEIAMAAFDETIDDARDLFNNGGSKDEYVAMRSKVLAAVEEVKKAIVPLDGGYFYMKNHYDSYGGGLSKFATYMNDFAEREMATSGTKPGEYGDDYMRNNMRSHRWMGETYWFGYGCVYDADFEAATAEGSNLPDKYIWRIDKKADGNFTLKNMAPSAECGDSTYSFATIRYTANIPGVSAWCQLAMRGMPQSEQILTWTGHNYYRITQSDNYYPLNMGNNFFNTQNPTNSMTYGLWEFHSVPKARITSKFKLNGAITDAGGVFQDWAIGDGPYEVKESYVADLRAKLAEARALYDNPGASDAECDAMTAALESIYQQTVETLKDTDKVQNPIADGYYFINCPEDWNIKWSESHYYQGGITTSYKKKQSIFIPRDGKEYYNDKAYKVLYKNTSYHMVATDDNQLMWNFNPEFIDTTAALDYHGLMKNPAYVKNDMYSAWKITATGKKSVTGKPLFTARNMATGGYLNLSASGKIYLSDEPKEVCFQNNLQQMLLFSTYYYQPMNLYRARGFFLVMNPEETYYLNLYGNIGAAGTAIENSNANKYARTIATNVSSNLYSTYWNLKPIEGEVLDSLLVIANNKTRVIEMHNLLGSAEAALANATVVTLGDSLITEAGRTVTPGAGENGEDLVEYDPTKTQIWMNQNQWGEGAYANLIDGNLATYVQSRWSTDGGPAAACTDFNAVIVDLKTPKSSIAFKHGARGNANILYGPLGQAPITYGVVDYGERYRLRDVAVYATNDTTAEWTEVAYIKDIPAIKDQRVYTSPLITTSEPYRYFKFSCLKNVGGQNYLGHPHIAPSYFQVFDAAVDEANSATAYSSEVAAAVNTLKPIVAQAWKAYKAESVPAELMTQITEATDALNAVVPNSWRLLSRIYDAKVLRDSTYTEDDPAYQQYGDATEAQKAAFEAAIEAAETAMAPESHPTTASLQAAYDALNEAYFTLNAQRKTFETDTWYYLNQTEYQSYHVRSNYTWRGNQHVYASGNVPQAPLEKQKMGNHASPVRWGHYTGYVDMPEGEIKPTSHGATANYTGGYFDDEGSPYSMWRIVQLGEPADSLYAIQNRANGLYIGRRQDYTDGSWNYVTLSKEPMPLKIALLGRNQYEILPVDSTCGFFSVQGDKVIPATGKYPEPIYEIGLPFHGQSSDFHMVWWGTGTERGYNTASAYTFSKGTCEGEVEIDPDDFFALPVKRNSIQIMTLPYAVDFSEGAITDAPDQDAQTYALKNIVQGEEYQVELTEKNTFEAGEPFILVVGEPQGLITEGQDSMNIFIDPADLNENGYRFDTTPVNGLVGVMYGDSIQGKIGMGVEFGGATLLLSKEAETYYIPGHGGYIDPTQVTDAGGNADKVIGGLVDAVKRVVAEKEEGTVNVYTADGKLVKSGVRRSEAKAGLAKGIYLIGKNKVMVR